MMDLYAKNRRALADRLPDTLIVAQAAPEVIRNGDVPFAYRQDSNFLYMTGIEEPGYTLLIDPHRNEETLFVPKLTQEHAVWLGHIPDLKEARERYGIEDVRYNDELEESLRKRAKGYKAATTDERALRIVRKATFNVRVGKKALEEALAELRAVKRPEEIELHRKASAASEAGHRAAMAATRPGLYEYQIQAELEREFRRHGCRHTAYGSIVAAGRNSAVLHYHHNTEKLRSGDFLLIDAGAEYKGYAADITRTFPVNGKFTTRQRDLYEVVLAAQKAAIDRARPGVTSLELHRHSEEALAEGLADLKILRGAPQELVESGAIRVFYPHGLSHMLGLDVHDVTGGKKRRIPYRRNGNLRYAARLEPGFVITIEPGIYFIPALLDDPEVRTKHRAQIDFERAKSYVNLGGIRIEDDVVVAEKGPPANLTKVPKEVGDIEAACAG